jgi:hypothetical protein
MFGWLKRLIPAREAKPDFAVEVDDEGVSLEAQGAGPQAIRFSDLAEVAIETNTGAPQGVDRWWLLYDGDGRIALTFPFETAGAEAMVERLRRLPGFDEDQMTAALAAARTDFFAVWTAVRTQPG